MSTVTDLKNATEQLSPNDKWELFVWLSESADIRTRRPEELRRDIAIGVEQADRAEVASLDISAIRTKVREKAGLF